MNALSEALLVLKTTAPQYFKEATDHTIRNRLILKILQSQGNIVMNVKSPKKIWDVEVKENVIRALGSTSRHVFEEVDPYVQMEITHAELEGTDIMKRRFQMINSNSPHAIVDEAGKKMDRLVKSLTRSLNKQFYVDASTGVNVDLMTGIQSFLKPNTAGFAAGDLVADPDPAATYGGQSVGLAQLGGQWSTDLGVGSFPNTALANDWPFGSGDPEYDWNSPKIFNTAADVKGDAGWENNCLKLMRRMSDVLESTGGEGAAPVVQLLGLDYYNDFKDKLEQRERLYISDYAKSLGFPDVMTYEGAVVLKDFDCPSSKGFAVNPNHMCLYSVHDQLFFTDSDWSTESQLSAFLVGFLGNYCWTPKLTGMYADLG